MSKHLKGEKPGWHVLNEQGAPISGPWQSKPDGKVHLKHKIKAGIDAALVLRNGKAVIVA